MKALEFINSTTQRIYSSYIARCKKAIRILSAADQEDCLMEINSYIYEHLQNNKGTNETEELLNVLDRLGAPEETLKEVVAAKKTQQAIQSFNPKHLIQSLVLNIKNGLFYTLLTLMLLLSLGFVTLAILKVFFYNEIGCYVGKHTFYFGFTGTNDNLTEILGPWFSPVTLILGILVYYVTILLLKIKNKKAKKN